MEKEEFYTRKEVPDEEIERLKQIEYPNIVSETLLNDFDLRGKRVLDVGAGPNSKLAEFVAEKGAKYVPLDVRADVLEIMKRNLEDAGLPFYGVKGDAKNLPFTDEAFEIIHQRFVLMHIQPDLRKQALKEILRVGKEDILLLEYNWRTLESYESPEIIQKFKDLAFQMFERFSADPFMGEKFEELFNEVDPNLNYSLRGFKRKESVANTPELILLLRSFHKAADNLLKDKKLAGEFEKLISTLKKLPISFVPPEIVAAIIKK